MVDFIFFLLETENDEAIWELWLAKDIEQDFKTFKKSNEQKLRMPTAKPMPKEDVEKNIENASRYIKQRKEG